MRGSSDWQWQQVRSRRSRRHLRRHEEGEEDQESNSDSEPRAGHVDRPRAELPSPTSPLAPPAPRAAPEAVEAAGSFASRAPPSELETWTAAANADWKVVIENTFISVTTWRDRMRRTVSAPARLLTHDGWTPASSSGGRQQGGGDVATSAIVPGGAGGGPDPGDDVASAPQRSDEPAGADSGGGGEHLPRQSPSADDLGPRSISVPAMSMGLNVGSPPKCHKASAAPVAGAEAAAGGLCAAATAMAGAAAEAGAGAVGSGDGNGLDEVVEVHSADEASGEAACMRQQKKSSAASRGRAALAAKQSPSARDKVMALVRAGEPSTPPPPPPAADLTLPQQEEAAGDEEAEADDAQPPGALPPATDGAANGAASGGGGGSGSAGATAVSSKAAKRARRRAAKAAARAASKAEPPAAARPPMEVAGTPAADAAGGATTFSAAAAPASARPAEGAAPVAPACRGRVSTFDGPCAQTMVPAPGPGVRLAWPVRRSGRARPSLQSGDGLADEAMLLAHRAAPSPSRFADANERRGGVPTAARVASRRQELRGGLAVPLGAAVLPVLPQDRGDGGAVPCAVAASCAAKFSEEESAGSVAAVILQKLAPEQAPTC